MNNCSRNFSPSLVRLVCARQRAESLEAVRSIEEERRNRILTLIRSEISCKPKSNKKKNKLARSFSTEDQLPGKKFEFFIQKPASCRDRASSLDLSTVKFCEHLLSVNRNAASNGEQSSATNEITGRRRRSLNDFVADKFSHTFPKSASCLFPGLNSGSQILTAAEKSFNGRKALKKWLMSIQKGLITTTEPLIIMSPDQSNGLCGRDMISTNDADRFKKHSFIKVYLLTYREDKREKGNRLNDFSIFVPLLFGPKS